MAEDRESASRTGACALLLIPHYRYPHDLEDAGKHLQTGEQTTVYVVGSPCYCLS